MSLYYTTTNWICRHCSPVWKWMVLNSHHTGFFKCSRIISIIHPPAFPQSAPHQDSETSSPLTSFSLYPFHTIFQHNLEHLPPHYPRCPAHLIQINSTLATALLQPAPSSFPFCPLGKYGQQHFNLHEIVSVKQNWWEGKLCCNASTTAIIS